MVSTAGVTMKIPPGLHGFSQELIAIQPAQTALTLLLLLAAGLTEGISLLVFVPALQLLHDPGAASGSITAQALNGIGVPLSLGPVLVLCALLVAARSLLVHAKNRAAAALHLGFANQLRKRFYHALAEAHWSTTGKLRSADLEETVTNGVGRIQSGVWALFLLTQAVILFAVYAALSMLISPTLTIAVASAGLLLLLALRGQRQRATQLGRVVNEGYRNSFRELSALVHGLKVAKSFGTEAVHSERFARSVDLMTQGSLQYTALRSQSSLYFQLAAGSLLAGTVYLGDRVLGLDLPALLVLIFCVVRLTPYLGQLQGFSQELLFALPALQATQALENQLHAAREQPPADAGRFTLDDALVAENLTLTYPGSNRRALDGVSIRLPAGSCTALVGPSGAGKSTIADILLGLITPDTGKVLVDGREITPESARAWRQRVAYVPQETFLLPESVRANLVLGTPEPSDAMLWAALDAAAAGDFVRALPQGLDTLVGERGSALSGGERQRLALARALLRKPLLLVMDEATSALDADNQERIGAALETMRGQVTILLIAHNPALVQRADRIVRIEQGQVVPEPGALGAVVQATN